MAAFTVHDARGFTIDILTAVREGDYETAHSLEDEAFREFVCCLRDKRYTSWEDVALVAQELCDVASMDHTRWYA